MNDVKERPCRNQDDHNYQVSLHDGGRQKIAQRGKWIVRKHYSPNVTQRWLAGLHFAADNAAVMRLKCPPAMNMASRLNNRMEFPPQPLRTASILRVRAVTYPRK